MVKYACRVDDNQPEIVEMFRALGWTVKHVHTIKNFADILISRDFGLPFNPNILVEIKDGNKPHSQRKLTKGEQEFHDSWPGHIVIVESVQDCLDLDKKMKEFYNV